MEDLERFEDCILDNKNSVVVDLNTSGILYFDFINMTVKHDEKKTLRPIRYITESGRIRYWSTNRWARFRDTKVSKAIAKLFDNFNERTLLGINEEEVESEMGEINPCGEIRLDLDDIPF